MSAAAVTPTQGGDAFMAGADVRTNPYPFETADYYRWHAEYYEAMAKAETRPPAKYKHAAELASSYRRQESILRQTGGQVAL
jgi:hypothetical protein